MVQMPQTQERVKITMKTIDLRELGETDERYMEEFIRHFRDVYLYGAVFAYCKNDAFCKTPSGYFTHFWVYNVRLGRCYNPQDFRQYFYWGYYNELLETGRVPTEYEVEQKILDFYINHLDILLARPLEVTIFKIYEKERILWIMKLPPDECFR